MRKAKKILSVCMAVVMLLTVLASVASALTYNPTLTSGEIKFSVQADETTVNPGDTVAISLYLDPGSFSDFGPPQFVISYNGDQLSPIATTNTTFREYQNEMGSRVSNTATVNFNLPTTGAHRNMTAEERAYYTNAIMLSGQFISGVYPNVAGGGWTPNPENPQMTFYMTVADDVQPGEEIWVGLHDSSFTGNMAYVSQAGAGRIATSNYDLTNSMVKLTVASAEEGPVVAKSRSQVKMTATSETTVADAFTFRVISTITDADWDAYFANTAAGGDTSAIQRLGFVAYKGTEGFDMETAKAVAQGTPTEGYDVAWTDYVQKADDSSDAYFGARLEITSAETRSDVTYVGVVEYLNADGTTAYAFYDAAGQALLNTNYDTIVEDYLAMYPYEA